MTTEVTQLAPAHEEAFADLLSTCPWAMVFHSLQYRRLLKRFLPTHAQDHYLVALEDGRLTGALPAFVLDGPLGPVVNSLPFFGSHGGILLSPDAGSDVAARLTQSFLELCGNRQATFATVIETPFHSEEGLLASAGGAAFRDRRIGQFTPLPSAEPEAASQVEERLLKLYHQKTRNIVRKALRSGLTFAHESGQEVLHRLHALHEANIGAIGGIPKPRSFFDAVAAELEHERDYRIYTARTGSGEIVCALLLLYFKDTVEYFIPATAEAWRPSQPLSALIHIAMRDAVLERQARSWNWGGTWLSQDGVYHFKSRWGTQDHPYQYHTRIFPGRERLQGVTRQALQIGYPWFYTVPFSELPQ